jgi:glycosyltransferase 2 family protein
VEELSFFMGLLENKSILVKGFGIFIGLSVLIMFGILFWTTEESTWQNLQDFKPVFIPLLIGVGVVRWLIDGMAFVTMAKHGSGIQLNPGRAAVIRLEGNLIADIIPLFIGIFTMHAYMLHKEKLSLSESVAISASRAMIPIFLFLINIPILFFMRSDPNSSKLFAKLIEAVSIPIVVAVAVIVYALFFPERIKALASKSVRWWGRVKFIHIERILSLEKRLFHEIDQFSKILRIYIKEKNHMLFRAAGWILLAFAADSAFALLIMWGFGYHPPLVRVIAYQFLIWPIWYLSPLPGQAGVFEISFLGFFSMFMPNAIIGLAVLAERLMFTYLPMVAGYYFLMGEFRRDRKFKKLVFEKGILENEEIEDVSKIKI